MSRRLWFLVLLLMFAATAFAQSKADCNVIQSKVLARAVPYCVILPPSYSADKTKLFPILYYLHGIGDNEQSLINTGGWSVYDDLLKQKKVSEMVIAAPAGFATFFIDSRNGKFAYETFFITEFMPAIEKKYRAGGSRSQRGLIGISMGGFGALHFAFAHPTMFGSVTGIMPALMEKLPDSFGSEMEERLMKQVFGDASNSSYYDKVSVFSLARRDSVADLKRMKIAFNAGANDDYGFESGVDALHKLLEKRGIPHDSHIYSGRHSMQYALSHFGDALELASRSFSESR